MTRDRFLRYIEYVESQLSYTTLSRAELSLYHGPSGTLFYLWGGKMKLRAGRQTHIGIEALLEFEEILGRAFHEEMDLEFLLT